eukprot:scaffold4707_cov117-Isochrysis_galbana.AAC.7
MARAQTKRQSDQATRHTHSDTATEKPPSPPPRAPLPGWHRTSRLLDLLMPCARLEADTPYPVCGDAKGEVGVDGVVATHRLHRHVPWVGVPHLLPLLKVEDGRLLAAGQVGARERHGGGVHPPAVEAAAAGVVGDGAGVGRDGRRSSVAHAAFGRDPISASRVAHGDRDFVAGGRLCGRQAGVAALPGRGGEQLPHQGLVGLPIGGAVPYGAASSQGVRARRHTQSDGLLGRDLDPETSGHGVLRVAPFGGDEACMLPPRRRNSVGLAATPQVSHLELQLLLQAGAEVGARPPHTVDRRIVAVYRPLAAEVQPASVTVPAPEGGGVGVSRRRRRGASTLAGREVPVHFPRHTAVWA